MPRLQFALTILLFTIFCSTHVGAQPNWTWAKSAANAGSDTGNDIATDTSGNVYTVGRFSPFTLVFDTLTISNPSGNTVFFLTKHDPAGNILWGRTVTGAANCWGNSVDTDSAGNVFITGYFNGNLPIGSTTLINTDQFGSTPDMFIAKYDTDGNFLWARNPSGIKTETGSYASVDPDGNCYVAGYFSGTAVTFGSTTVSNSDATGNSPDIFLAKYDPNGNVLWAKSIGEVSDELPSGLSADVYGNVVLGAFFSGPFVILGTDTLTNNGTYGDMFIVKYDSSGNQLWTVHEGGPASDYMNNLDTGPHGEIVITGQYQSLSMTFGTATVTNSDGVGNYSDIFTAKYDANGNFKWVTTAGGNRSDHANSVSVDQFGNAFITGGFTSGNCAFGSTSITNSDNINGNSYDIFIARYDSSGVFSWVRKTGADDEDDIGFSVTTDRYNTCSFTGYFRSPIVVFGSDTLDNSSTSSTLYLDVFIAHLEDPTGVRNASVMNPSIAVAPNPSATGRFNFTHHESSGEVVICDMNGAVVQRRTFTSSVFEVDLASVPAGVYFATLYSDSGSSSVRIVKTP